MHCYYNGIACPTFLTSDPHFARYAATDYTVATDMVTRSQAVTVILTVQTPTVSWAVCWATVYKMCWIHAVEIGKYCIYAFQF